MRVVTRIVGPACNSGGRGISIDWPPGWAVPRVDEVVMFADGTLVFVREVTWYPQGEGMDEDDPSDVTEPFVHVVLGPRREM